MWTTFHRATFMLFAVLLAIGVSVAQETQTFDSEATATGAGWIANEEGQNPERDCDLCETDLGWKDSNLAGGASAGEGGGLVHRSGNLPIAFYGDTTIGELTLDMPLSASGKVTLLNIDFDGHQYFGFFDGKRLLEDPLDYGAQMGFFLAEPGGGVAPNFRWGYTVVTDNGVNVQDHTAFVDGAPDSEPLDFSIDYDPDGGAGDGLLTLTIGDEPSFEFELTPDLRSDTATLTSFGIFTGPYLGSADSRSMEVLLDDVTYSSSEGNGATALQPGDADQDLDFDQLDLVQVQVAAKYLSGQPATWGEGDWNGAPGGSVGMPPAGDGVFDQLDIISALSAGRYLTGPYAAVAATPAIQGDGQTSIIYNPGTGEVAVDAPAGIELTSINIDSAGGIFTGDAAANLGGSFDNDGDNNIFKATFGGSFGSISFGNAAQVGLDQQFVLGDLTVVGSLAGGGALGAVDLIYVPEPAGIALLTMGLLAWFAIKFRSTTS